MKTSDTPETCYARSTDINESPTETSGVESMNKISASISEQELHSAYDAMINVQRRAQAMIDRVFHLIASSQALARKRSEASCTGTPPKA